MNNNIHLVTVPFNPSYEQFKKIIKLEWYPEVEEEAQYLFNSSIEKLTPTAVYYEATVEDRFTEDLETHLIVDSVHFQGKVLSELNDLYRVFPYIATCGEGMESEDLSSLDMLAPFWLDSLKTMALGTARLALANHLKERYKFKNINSVNPGSGNMDIWPIQQLSGIFELLKRQQNLQIKETPVNVSLDLVDTAYRLDAIGVTLTKSSVMLPNKTIAGMFFNSDHDYSSCIYCERDACPGRKAPFGGKRL